MALVNDAYKYDRYEPRADWLNGAVADREKFTVAFFWKHLLYTPVNGKRVGCVVRRGLWETRFGHQVGVIFVCRGHIALVKTAPNNGRGKQGLWGIPKGSQVLKFDDGEYKLVSPRVSASRELYEETGIRAPPHVLRQLSKKIYLAKMVADTPPALTPRSDDVCEAKWVPVWSLRNTVRKNKKDGLNAFTRYALKDWFKM